MIPTAEDVRAVARRLADELLFPDAMRVDRLDVLPTAHLDALAAASELAIRAAAALAVRDGSNSITVDQHAQRLAREAVFLLVFGCARGSRARSCGRLGAAAD